MAAAALSQELQALQEIALPPPLPYWPQTWGWLALLLLAIAVIAAICWQRWRRYRADRYRREALRRLDELERELRADTTRAQALRALPALLKRTALSAAPRELSAALSGADWLHFLDAADPARAGFSAAGGSGRLLWQLAYADSATLNAIPPHDIAALCAQLRYWIARHRVVPATASNTGKQHAAV